MADLLAVKAEIDVPISEHTADEAALGLARAGAVDVFNTGLGYAGIEPCRRTSPWPASSVCGR